MKKMIVTALLISICFTLFAGCNKNTNTIESNKSPIRSKVTDTICKTENSSTPKSKINSNDEDLMKKVDSISSPIEQMALIFNSLKDFGKVQDPRLFLNISMKKLFDFLHTAESYSMTEIEYKKVLSSLKVFTLAQGKIITYRGPAVSFGQSSDCMYTFYQVKLGTEIMVYKLFENSSGTISNACVASESNESIILLIGGNYMGTPNIAFINGFKVSKSGVEKIPLLTDYKNDKWEVHTTGEIVRVDKPLTGSWVENLSVTNAIVGSNAEDGDKLELIFDKTSLKFVTKMS
jgi:hypothetical protein